MNEEIGQIKTAIAESAMPLIILEKNPSPDAVASGLALNMILQKLGKKSEIISINFTPEKKIKFLPLIDSVLSNLSHIKNFIISLDASNIKIDDLRYTARGDKLNIFISPKEGEIKNDDIRFGTTKFKHDLIIALDAENLENFGGTYDTNIDFFYETPVINIDHKPGNGRFGQINIVDLSSSSVAEIIFKIFSDKEHLFDEDIATSLLAGIISKTKSFKTASITPRILEIASRLMSLGARRETIVDNLYKQQTVPILKLWGRALVGLKHDSKYGIVWSLLGRQDFLEAGAEPKHLLGVIDELLVYSPEAKIIVFIYEMEDNEIHCLIKLNDNFNGKNFALVFGQKSADNHFQFKTNGKNLIEAEKIILEKIKKTL